MAKEKSTMPSTTAGLTRYYEESPEAIKLKPEEIVAVIGGIIGFEAILYLLL